MARYRIARAFERIPEITGLSLTRHGNKWQGGYYLNGDTHFWRRDKLKVVLWKNDIFLFEEGGRGMSLLNWMVNFGGASDFRDAVSIIEGRQEGLKWSEQYRDIVSPKVQYVGRDVLEGAMRYDLENCPLFRWFCTLFDEDRVVEAFRRYNVTTDSKGLAVFWSVDYKGRILHDKRMRYMENGHRDKRFGGTRIYKTADGYSARCAFGSHLIPQDGKKDILVVESEKSALGLYLYTGKTVIATGGKNNLRERDERLLCYPDKDAFEDWESTGNRCVRWFDDWALPLEAQPSNADVMDMIEWNILCGKK